MENYKKSRELWDKSYTCKKEELQNLLQEIESKIKQKGPDNMLSRAKTVVTTRLLLSIRN